MGLLITILLVLGAIYAVVAGALLLVDGEPLGEALLWPRRLWSLWRLP